MVERTVEGEGGGVGHGRVGQYDIDFEQWTVIIAIVRKESIVSVRRDGGQREMGVFDLFRQLTI